MKRWKAITFNINQNVMFKICVYTVHCNMYTWYVYHTLIHIWRINVLVVEKKENLKITRRIPFVYSNLIKITFDWKFNNISTWRKQSSANLNGSTIHMHIVDRIVVSNGLWWCWPNTDNENTLRTYTKLFSDQVTWLYNVKTTQNCGFIWLIGNCFHFTMLLMYIVF